MKQKPGERDVIEAAYRYLAVRAHSVAELSRKLKQKGYCSQKVTEAVKHLEHLGYLDDEALAGRWAELLIERRCWGRYKISAYLQQKGIGRPVIEKIERTIWKQYNEEEVARKAVRKKFSTPGGEPPGAKVLSFLRSRGFSADTIFRVVRSG